MTVYANLHFALEPLRSARRGPRVMVVGAPDTGKSWLSRMLANYAVRVGHRPLLVDLDISRGCMAVPGTMGAVCLQQPTPLHLSTSALAPYVRFTSRSDCTCSLIRISAPSVSTLAA
jgi:polyribonucleotide 5'-hydroxyl-kinase